MQLASPSEWPSFYGSLIHAWDINSVVCAGKAGWEDPKSEQTTRRLVLYRRTRNSFCHARSRLIWYGIFIPVIESRSVDCLLNTKISFPDHKTHHLLPPWSKQSDSVEISLPCPRILKGESLILVQSQGLRRLQKSGGGAIHYNKKVGGHHLTRSFPQNLWQTKYKFNN